MSYGANQYKQTAVKTANRGQILIMLYEGAIKHLKLAMLAMDRKDLPAKGMAIGKAHDIINELNNSLDHSVGGKVAADLERLYTFMGEQLVQANLKNEKAPLETCLKLLDNLLSAWKQAVTQVNSPGAGAGKQQP